MIVSLDDFKLHLGIIDDADDAMLADKLAAAQAHLERRLGFKIDTRYGGESQDPVPDDLKEATLSLGAHFYENREGTVVGLSAQDTPLSVVEIIRAYRDWWQ